MSGARFDYLEEKLAGSRIYPETKSMSAKVEASKEINNMLKKKFGRVADGWLDHYAHSVVNQRSNEVGNRTWIAIQIVICTITSALRWNRSVTAEMRNKLHSRFRKWAGRL
jgi:hypothetical protein